MAQVTQDRRLAQLQTPLGKDVLVLASFVAAEGLSELFEFNVEALSEEENINFDKAIGQACTIKQITCDDKTRYYNGILTATRRIGKSQDLFQYNLVLRPWLWLLGRKTDCRIFLEKDVKEIISNVFKKAGFSDFEFRTTGEYPENILLRPVSRNRSGVLQPHDGALRHLLLFRARRRQAHTGDGELAGVPQVYPGSAQGPVHLVARRRTSY